MWSFRYKREYSTFIFVSKDASRKRNIHATLLTFTIRQREFPVRKKGKAYTKDSLYLYGRERGQQRGPASYARGPRFFSCSVMKELKNSKKAVDFTDLNCVTKANEALFGSLNHT